MDIVFQSVLLYQSCHFPPRILILRFILFRRASKNKFDLFCWVVLPGLMQVPCLPGLCLGISIRFDSYDTEQRQNHQTRKRGCKGSEMAVTAFQLHQVISDDI